ncbi:MAG TPA: hypothetical protein VD908_13380 [Cytophagales bacterium]|nr:hypothetical protein [Cytophagales bacterium]
MIFFLICNFTFSQEVESFKTGNWSSADTWVIRNISGTISTPWLLVNYASDQINGVGTNFLSQIGVDDTLVNSSNQIIGVVKEITSNTRLKLKASTSSGFASIGFMIRKMPRSFHNVTINSSHTVTVTSNVAVNSLTVESGSTLNVGSNSLNIGGNLVNNGTLSSTSAIVNFSGTNNTISGSSGTTFGTLTASGTGTLSLASNATVENGGTLDMPASKPISINSNTLTVGGNISATTIFTGTSSANLILAEGYSLSGSLTFANGGQNLNNLTINGDGNINLGSPLFINGVLTFPSNGKLISSAANYITLGTAASHVQGSSNSFVSGPLAKVVASTTKFIFPIGKDTLFRQVSIEPKDNSLSTFKIEYFQEDPHSVYGSEIAKLQDLHHVSSIEYWDIDRTSGANEIKITLFWGASSHVSDQFIDYTDLVMGHFDTSDNEWKREGNVSYDPASNFNSGSITTEDYVSSFSPFTLASSTTNNPLPITIKEFKGEATEIGINLMWELTNPNDHLVYEIEKFNPVTQNFDQIGLVPSTDKLYYNFIDTDIEDLENFYRIRYSNIYDEEFSKIIEVKAEDLQVFSSNSIKLYPNPTKGNIHLTIPEGYHYPLSFSIINSFGWEMHKGEATSSDELERIISFKITNLKSSTYHIRFNSINKSEIVSIIKN